MLTPDGHCKALDASADGYVRGEASIAAWLSPANANAGAALSLVSACVNQDGRSSSLTAPNGPSQQQVRLSERHRGFFVPTARQRPQDGMLCTNR
jgi:acyl transferase domain-containing protein